MEGPVLPLRLRVDPGTAVGFAVLLLAGAGLAESARAVELPAPALAAVEPEVRQKIEALGRRAAASPADGSLWGRYGMALEAHDFVAEAEVAYREACAGEEDEFRWPYFLAALLELSDAPAAVAWLERAIDLDPAYSPARVRFGEVNQVIGKGLSSPAVFWLPDETIVLSLG